MNFGELFIIAVGLSMDAFAIAVCKGLSVRELHLRHAVITGLWFGGAQALMPVIGYFLGSSFHSFIEAVDHWISFGLLLFIGINMIREAREKEENLNDSFTAKAMLPLAIADSIDALAVGVAFAFENVNIIIAAVLIGIVTFILSAAGVKIGNKFGSRYKSAAETAGGIILIVMGVSILLQEYGIIG